MARRDLKYKPGEDGYWPQGTADEERMRRDRRLSRGILKNPGRRQLAALLRSVSSPRDGLRGMLLGGDIYWWDSGHGTHSDAYRVLGVLSDREHAAEIELHVEIPDGPSYLGDGKEEGLPIYLTAKRQEGVDRALLHPTLVGGFDKNGYMKDSAE
jgi:hypothetical protein